MTQKYLVVKIPTFQGHRMLVLNGLVVSFTAAYAALTALGYAPHTVEPLSMCVIILLALGNFITQLTTPATVKPEAEDKNVVPRTTHKRDASDTGVFRLSETPLANDSFENLPMSHASANALIVSDYDTSVSTFVRNKKRQSGQVYQFVA